MEACSNTKWEPLSENVISTSNINIEHPILTALATLPKVLISHAPSFKTLSKCSTVYELIFRVYIYCLLCSLYKPWFCYFLLESNEAHWIRPLHNWRFVLSSSSSTTELYSLLFNTNIMFKYTWPVFPYTILPACLRFKLDEWLQIKLQCMWSRLNKRTWMSLLLNVSSSLSNGMTVLVKCSRWNRRGREWMQTIVHFMCHKLR